MSRFLIVGGGPFVSKALLEKVSTGATVIALDGAANELRNLGLKPGVILGDFDSIKNPESFGIKKTYFDLEETDEPYLGEEGILIVPRKNQNKTDLMKAIEFADSKGASEIDLICAEGRPDHALMNLRALKRYAKEKRPLSLLTEKQRLFYLNDGKVQINGQKGDPCAVMAFPEAVVSSEGLCWEMKDYPLIFSEQEGACNRLERPFATISVRGHALIMAPLASPLSS